VRAMFEANFFGLVALPKRVLPGMRARGRGHIVNISSVGGLIGNPSGGYYNATKFAVEGLSEALAKEVAPLGIRVTAIEPGGKRGEEVVGHRGSPSHVCVKERTSSELEPVRHYTGLRVRGLCRSADGKVKRGSRAYSSRPWGSGSRAGERCSGCSPRSRS